MKNTEYQNLTEQRAIDTSVIDAKSSVSLVEHSLVNESKKRTIEPRVDRDYVEDRPRNRDV